MRNIFSKNGAVRAILDAGSIIAFLLVGVFLTGNIITIPYGTTAGAIICGVGVLVILITITALMVGVALLIHRRN